VQGHASARSAAEWIQERLLALESEEQEIDYETRLKCRREFTSKKGSFRRAT